MGRPPGIPLSPEHKAKLMVASRAAHLGKSLSDEWKKNISEGTRKGMTEEVRAHLSDMKQGSRHWRWIEDRTRLKARRHGIDPLLLKEWRKKVLERDDYTCQKCGQRGGKLCGDHIKPIALFPEFALELSNGRTLCETCHRLTNTFCGRVTKLSRENFQEAFIDAT